MGVFDRVVLEGGDGQLDIAVGEEFQTKSMEPCNARYLIGRDGLLRLADGTAVPFHGDIHLVRGSDQSGDEFVARFTAGKLEWIRPVDEYPENLAMLLGRGP